MELSKKNRYVFCHECESHKKINGICKKCGHKDEPALAGMVPDVLGLSVESAEAIFAGPEAQLVLGEVATEYDENIPSDKVIRTDPVAGTQLEKGSPVNIVISLGSAS